MRAAVCRYKHVSLFQGQSQMTVSFAKYGNRYGFQIRVMRQGKTHYGFVPYNGTAKDPWKTSAAKKARAIEAELKENLGPPTLPNPKGSIRKTKPNASTRTKYISRRNRAGMDLLEIRYRNEEGNWRSTEISVKRHGGFKKALEYAKQIQEERHHLIDPNAQ